MTNFNVLKSNLEELSLTKMLEVLPNVMNNSAKNKVPLADSLLELTNAEIEFRDDRAKKINITVSHFPYIKTFKDFDFSYQPSIKKEQIADLMTLRFIETKTNIVFMGIHIFYQFCQAYGKIQASGKRKPCRTGSKTLLKIYRFNYR